MMCNKIPHGQTRNRSHQVEYNIPTLELLGKSKNENFSDIDSAIIETVKYSVKHSDLCKRSNEDFYYLYTQTKSMRFISAGGILKEHLNLIKIDEDLINLKKENEALWIEIARLIYTWQNGEYCLKEIKPPKPKEQIENRSFAEQEI